MSVSLGPSKERITSSSANPGCIDLSEVHLHSLDAPEREAMIEEMCGFLETGKYELGWNDDSGAKVARIILGAGYWAGSKESKDRIVTMVDLLTSKAVQLGNWGSKRDGKTLAALAEGVSTLLSLDGIIKSWPLSIGGFEVRDGFVFSEQTERFPSAAVRDLPLFAEFLGSRQGSASCQGTKVFPLPEGHLMAFEDCLRSLGSLGYGSTD